MELGPAASDRGETVASDRDETSLELPERKVESLAQAVPASASVVDAATSSLGALEVAALHGTMDAVQALKDVGFADNAFHLQSKRNLFQVLKQEVEKAAQVLFLSWTVLQCFFG